MISRGYHCISYVQVCYLFWITPRVLYFSNGDMARQHRTCVHIVYFKWLKAAKCITTLSFNRWCPQSKVDSRWRGALMIWEIMDTITCTNFYFYFSDWVWILIQHISLILEYGLWPWCAEVYHIWTTYAPVPSLFCVLLINLHYKVLLFRYLLRQIWEMWYQFKSSYY